MWMESLYGHEKFLAGGSAIFVLGEWVVKIDLLTNIGRLIGQWADLFTKSNSAYSPNPTHWPTG